MADVKLGGGFAQPQVCAAFLRVGGLFAVSFLTALGDGLNSWSWGAFRWSSSAATSGSVGHG